ncbi:MAG: hypothetical protein FVQ79_07445 [Planctomycetes bacterium]|nr:hypothetical protein [Planctomycetota bacterium]
MLTNLLFAPKAPITVEVIVSADFTGFILTLLFLGFVVIGFAFRASVFFLVSIFVLIALMLELDLMLFSIGGAGLCMLLIFLTAREDSF